MQEPSPGSTPPLHQLRDAGPPPSCLASKFSNRLAYLGAICLSAPATGIPFLQVRRWALGRLEDVILPSTRQAAPAPRGGERLRSPPFWTPARWLRATHR